MNQQEMQEAKNNCKTSQNLATRSLCLYKKSACKLRDLEFSICCEATMISFFFVSYLEGVGVGVIVLSFLCLVFLSPISFHLWYIWELKCGYCCRFQSFLGLRNAWELMHCILGLKNLFSTMYAMLYVWCL